MHFVFGYITHCELIFPTVVLFLVTQGCLTLCNPMDCSPLGSSVHGDSPGKNTGVVCHALLQGICPTQDQTQVSDIAGIFFTIWATREALPTVVTSLFRFILWHVDVQLSHHHSLRLSFLHWIPFTSLLWPVDYICVGLFLGNLFVPLINMYIILLILHCLNYCIFILNVEIRWLYFFSFVLLQYYFDYAEAFF